MISLQRILRRLRKEARPEAGHHSRSITSSIDGPKQKDESTPKSSSRTKTKAISENESVAATQESRTASHDAGEASVPIIKSESSHSFLIGQTPQSTITISSWNSSKVIIKKHRTPNIPQAADTWRHEVNMLKLISIHVSPFTSTAFAIEYH